MNDVLHRNKSKTLPDHTSEKSLANALSQFFIGKITRIRQGFSKILSHNIVLPNKCPSRFFRSFTKVSEDKIRKIINNSPTKSCSLDPWPTFLVKECVDILVVPITSIVNMSLQSGLFPDDFKQAIVTPLIKKPTLSKNDYKNYRPVSGLNFISKIIERVEAEQINEHIMLNGLENVYQSAYRKSHSTESALLKLKNDIHLNLAEGKPTALVLLDLSAAFDTIDHNTLIDRLCSWFGICGITLDWFSSYLFSCHQSVKVNNATSDPQELMFGIPQGSVLGPLLFSMCTTPLSMVISAFKDVNLLLIC